MEQRNPLNIVKERMQNKRKNLSKPEQSLKTNFFEALTLLRSENPELRKVAYISQDYAQKLSRCFNFSEIYGELNGGQQKSVPAQRSKSSINFPLETLLGTTIRKSKDTKELLQK